MTVALVRPSVVSGTLEAPPSKSETHRALVLAALSPGGCTVRNVSECSDARATLQALLNLGADVRGAGRTVPFGPSQLRPARQPIRCLESRTTLNLVGPQAARLGPPSSFLLEGSLRGRPTEDLAQALAPFGGRVDRRGAVAEVRGPLRPGVAAVRSTSSQPASGLVLALPMLDGPSLVELAAPMPSRPYLDLTLHVARRFGLRIDEERLPRATCLHVRGGEAPAAAGYTVSGDWSSAAFPLAAAAITGGALQVRGLESASPQGDQAFLAHLAAFGVQVTGNGVAEALGPLRSPGFIDVTETPDLFPVLAVLAAVSSGRTTLSGSDALREKESDRVAAMAEGLRAFGIDVKERPAGLEIRGGRPVGGMVPCPADHRIHMALCTLALAAAGPTTVQAADSVDKSWPDFHVAMRTAGASVEVA